MPPRDRRDPLPGRRDADGVIDKLWLELRELREDLGDLATDLSEIVRWKAVSEDRDRRKGEAMIRRRNWFVFWMGVGTFSLALLEHFSR